MSKKIIQLSTKQCPPCQEYRRKIENIIDKTDYEYEYISLYKGLKNAANAVNGNKTIIGWVCQGKRETAYNFKWKYKN